MYTAQNDHSSPPQRIPGSRSGGFPFQAHLIPPIAVILISIILACILSQVPIAVSDPPPKNEAFIQEEMGKNVQGEKQIASLFTPEVQYWEPKILSWSKDLNLDPNLVATVMQIESCGDPKATSSVGAMGLFQVMPYHFSSGENPYKPNINARRGLAFLKKSPGRKGK